MGICAIPVFLCKTIQKLPGKICHKELPWVVKVCCGLGYLLLVLTILVCCPLVYILLPILSCPLLCSSAGRQRFKLIHKHALVLPFKILWFYHLRCERRAQEIAFEREKPRPIPLQLRRRLSQAPYCPETQLRALFFSKLPFEIRLQIYREVIIGDGKHVHVVVHNPKKDDISNPRASANAMRAGKIRGYRCGHAFDSCNSTALAWHLVDPTQAEIVYAGYNVIRPGHFSISFPKNRGWGPVTLVKCCRQMYLEAIDLLYSQYRSVLTGPMTEQLIHPGLQTFSFLSLTPPPFFLRSVLPHRLAQIKSIQLCYNHITMSSLCRSDEGDRRAALHAHRMQKCHACNLLAWSELIKENLKGLRIIEVFIYLGGPFTVPTPNTPWIERLLDLQYGINGLRELKVKVLPKPWMAMLDPPTDTARLNSMLLNSMLQGMIKKGVDNYMHREQEIT